MNTLIVNKTEQTATEQLFYFPGILPPRQLRCINNRLVVENHKTLMGSALWTICKTEVRRSWPGSWLCLPSPEQPPAHARQPQVAQLAHRKLQGWARRVFQLSREGSWGSSRDSRLQCLSTPGKVPGTASCLREEAKLFSSFPPCSLTQPTAKEETSPGIMQIRVWTGQNTESEPENKEWTICCHCDKNNN